MDVQILNLTQQFFIINYPYSSVSSLFMPMAYADDTTLSSNLNTLYIYYTYNETPENEINNPTKQNQ